MHLQRLRAFRALMMTGSVTRAASRLLLTQPAVSRSLTTLETELGFRLFTRKRGKLVPTAEGEAFYRQSERILHGIEDLKEIANGIRTNHGSHLRVMSMPPLARGFIPKVVSTFAAEFPSIKISVETQSRRDVSFWIGGLQFDVGFASLPVQHSGLRSKTLATIPLVAVLPVRSKLAAKRKLLVEDFENEPFVALDHSSLVRHAVDGMFYEHGIAPRIAFETSSAHTACQFAAQGLGVTIVDSFTAMDVTEGVVHKFWADIPCITYGLLFPSDGRPSQALTRFAEIAEQEAGTFLATLRKKGWQPQ